MAQNKEIQLPELGEGVAEGELVKWLVKVGDEVKADQAVAELMTDKATVEVPTPISGKVVSLHGKEGDVIKVGDVLIVLNSDAAVKAHKPEPTKAATPPPAPAKEMSAKPATEVSRTAATSAANASTGMEVYPPAATERVLATPSTRRLARELSVDINNLSGSGLAGRVTRDDVIGSRKVTHDADFKNGSIPNLTNGEREEHIPLRGIRKKIAENMQHAKHVIPHFTLMDEANVTSLHNMREDLKKTGEKLGVKITYLPIMMKALVATAREFPMFNASIDDDKQEIIYKRYYNIGFAADTPNGLVVPVVKAVERKTILQVAKEINDLAERARIGKLKLDEMQDATVTITNIGSIGGSYATPIINHPEVAILGMYRIQDKPVIENGELLAKKYMNLTITADHRLIDGAKAAYFLSSFIRRLENPSVLLLDMI